MDWRITVTGAEHVPASGPAIVACNHVSYLDPFALGIAVWEQRRRRMRYLAKRELFTGRVRGRLLRRLGQIPVDRGGDAGDAMGRAQGALRRGELVGLFPEGTISTSFVPTAVKTGAARLALLSGAPLIPAAVWGGQRVATKGRPREARRGVPLVVRFGSPIGYQRDDEVEDLTQRLGVALRDLVDAAALTYPEQPAGDDDRWWLPRHLGGTAPTVADDLAERDREAAQRRARRASG